MKKRNIIIFLTITLLALLVIGGTMAWFTSTPDALENNFTAGTVEIEVDEHGFKDVEDVNPGDTYTKQVSVKSSGSKQTYVRVKLTPQWNPSNLSVHLVTLNTNDGADDDWVFHDGWYYYKWILRPGALETTLLLESVTFDSEEMGNEYQGATFTLKVEAEAVQASHDAYKTVWGLGELPPGVEPWNPIP